MHECGRPPTKQKVGGPVGPVPSPGGGVRGTDVFDSPARSQEQRAVPTVKDHGKRADPLAALNKRSLRSPSLGALASRRRLLTPASTATDTAGSAAWSLRRRR